MQRTCLVKEIGRLEHDVNDLYGKQNPNRSQGLLGQQVTFGIEIHKHSLKLGYLDISD
jgi:hypothetical protein